MNVVYQILEQKTETMAARVIFSITFGFVVFCSFVIILLCRSSFTGVFKNKLIKQMVSILGSKVN